MWAVLPCKNSKDAKQRLSPILREHERREFFLFMLEDVLSALVSTPGLHGIVMVTRDVEAQRLAAQFGAEVWLEHENMGHTAAVRSGARFLAATNRMSMITIPGDVPSVTPNELEQVIEAHRPAPSVTIAPARDKLGSNAVACSPPDVVSLRFGDNSFYPHLRSVREKGIEPCVIESPGLGLDIDRPDDLAEFSRTPSATRTYAYLQSAGLLERILGEKQTGGNSGCKVILKRRPGV